MKLLTWCRVVSQAELFGSAGLGLSGGSRPSVWGGNQIGGRHKCLHLLKYQRLSATKEVIVCRSKSCYFCWSNYAIFQGITSLKALYIINSENF